MNHALHLHLKIRMMISGRGQYCEFVHLKYTGPAAGDLAEFPEFPRRQWSAAGRGPARPTQPLPCRR